jgi:hypothetical protein
MAKFVWQDSPFFGFVWSIVCLVYILQSTDTKVYQPIQKHRLTYCLPQH